jgi:hypothetical protein
MLNSEDLTVGVIVCRLIQIQLRAPSDLQYILINANGLYGPLSSSVKTVQMALVLLMFIALLNTRKVVFQNLLRSKEA